MRWPTCAIASRPPSTRPAPDLRNGEDACWDDCARPDGGWVDDDEDASGHTTEAGGVALIDGDLERYRDNEANPD